jgi:CarD family transcriptional regulator
MRPPATTGEEADERRETHASGKATQTGGARKTLNREIAGLAVDDESNGVLTDRDAQRENSQDVKVQAPVSEESPLKAEASDELIMTGKSTDAAPAPKGAAAMSGKQKPASKDEAAPSAKAGKPSGARQGFKLNEFVVYPAHGVGQIVAIEEQEVAGFKLELFVISFSKDKMTLRVPTSKVTGVGMRKISDPDTAKRSLEILSGRARVKRTMWSRRAQEYETKINSGDITAIAEVVRDLYRSEAQPEQSYSERQLYEAALDRMVREIAAVQKSNEIDALKAVEAQLQKTHGRQVKAGSVEAADPEIEEAA